MDAEIKRKQQRQAAQPKIFKQNPERTEPAKRARKKNNAGNITEQ